MKLTEYIMGMDFTIEILDSVKSEGVEQVLNILYGIEEIFSPYKRTSDIYKLNAKKVTTDQLSLETKKVFRLCQQAKSETNGYFDITIEHHVDPSGMIKGYALDKSAQALKEAGHKNFYIELGADLYVSGLKNNHKWKVGFRNSISQKIYSYLASNCGISTSGFAKHGLPLYNPFTKKICTFFKSVTVISENSCKADIYSTALFSMGEKALDFAEEKDIMAYFVKADGTEFLTQSLSNYLG